MSRGAESDLYLPIKAFLTAQGYDVKGEVRGCDIVALRGDEPPLIVELKLRFSLALVLQGVERLSLSDRVYLAVPSVGRRRRGAPSPEDRAVRKLCRMLGLGLLALHPRRQLPVEVVVEPTPYRPRQSALRRQWLLAEHGRRIGDPNSGGINRRPIVTAYRQEALRCAELLRCGPLALAELRRSGQVPRAGRILQQNVYGWFERVARGTYGLAPAGAMALVTFAHALAPPEVSPR